MCFTPLLSFGGAGASFWRSPTVTMDDVVLRRSELPPVALDDLDDAGLRRSEWPPVALDDLDDWWLLRRSELRRVVCFAMELAVGFRWWAVGGMPVMRGNSAAGVELPSDEESTGWGRRPRRPPPADCVRFSTKFPPTYIAYISIRFLHVSLYGK